jgi:hypothetical protein
MAINKEWHEKNKMPRNPTFEQSSMAFGTPETLQLQIWDPREVARGNEEKEHRTKITIGRMKTILGSKETVRKV